MVLDTDTSPMARCRRCGQLNERADRFCARCGHTLAPSIPSQRNGTGGISAPGPTAAVHSSKITRFLCAAAHLDPTFAHAAIAEYLIEPTRALPRSEGVDSTAVLRDAVAARRRGKIRDALLLFVIVIFAAVDFYAAVIWFVIAWLVAAAVSARRRGPIIVSLVVAVLLGAVLVYLLRTHALADLGITTTGPSNGDLIVGLLFLMIVYGIVAVDEFTVEALVRERFRESTFQPDANQLAPSWERTVRTLGLGDFATPLQRVAMADAPTQTTAAVADVVVHRTTVPFVGSGSLKADQTLALELLAGDEDVGAPRPFTAIELADYVTAAVRALRGSTPLSPSSRLANLTVSEKVFIPATRLVGGLLGPRAAPVLVDSERPPARTMPLDVARALADAPLESARYYRCFRIESWESDIITSTHFSASTDQQVLYLEWTHNVLYPVRRQYRSIDHPTTVHHALRAATIAVTLPRFALQRLKNVIHWFRRIPRRPGEFVPERYGSGSSLRELAADSGWHNYFQEADIVRYIRLVEQTIFRAIGDFLAERGYSVTDVLDVARTKISNNITISGGIFSGTAIGIGSTRQNNAPPPQQQQTNRGHSEP
jgi:hypothetical protein